MNFAAQLARTAECARREAAEAERTRLARMTPQERRAHENGLRCLGVITDTPQTALQIAEKAEITENQVRIYLGRFYDKGLVDRTRRTSKQPFLWVRK